VYINVETQLYRSQHIFYKTRRNKQLAMALFQQALGRATLIGPKHHMVVSVRPDSVSLVLI
jgi:hypothetical protein